jgi:hypothetical protein
MLCGASLLVAQQREMPLLVVNEAIRAGARDRGGYFVHLAHAAPRDAAEPH